MLQHESVCDRAPAVLLFQRSFALRKGHDLVPKQREAVLEVIRRLNPVKCMQAHRVFLRDNSSLLQYVCHIFSSQLSR